MFKVSLYINKYEKGVGTQVSLTSKGAGLTFDLPSDCFPLVGNAYDVAPLPVRERFQI